MQQVNFIAVFNIYYFFDIMHVEYIFAILQILTEYKIFLNKSTLIISNFVSITMIKVYNSV